MNILIAEDEALIAFWLGSLVTEAGHCLLGTCKTLDEAKAICRDGAPDMGIIDLRLGQKRCGASIDRFLGESFGTTSIYLTANRDFAFRYRAHAIGYLEKPVEADDVLGVLKYVEAFRAGRKATAPRRLRLFEPEPELARLARRG